VDRECNITVGEMTPLSLSQWHRSTISLRSPSQLLTQPTTAAARTCKHVSTQYEACESELTDVLGCSQYYRQSAVSTTKLKILLVGGALATLTAKIRRCRRSRRCVLCVLAMERRKLHNNTATNKTRIRAIGAIIDAVVVSLTGCSNIIF
jgi:hypothetical protein